MTENYLRIWLVWGLVLVGIVAVPREGYVADATVKCYPNPFRPEMGRLRISYSGKIEPGTITAVIYDLGWTRVRSLQPVSQSVRNGELNVLFEWDGRNDKHYLVRPGLYTCVLVVGRSQGRTQKVARRKFARIVVLP